MPALLLISCLIVWPAYAQEVESLRLPQVADSMLSEVFPGWRYTTDENGLGVFRQYEKRNWPWLLEADFDGDNQRDYVVHISYEDSTETTQLSIVALMCRGRGYSVITVGRGGDGLMLSVQAKGSVLWEDWSDAGTDKEPLWEFENDAIQLGYEGKPPSNYWIWREGRFVSISELLY